MANNIMEARLKWRAAGDYCENVFHWVNTSSGVNGWELARLLYNAINDTAIPPTWRTTLRAIMSAECFMSTVSVRCIYPDPDSRIANQYEPTTWIGGNSSGIYTAETAYVINWICTTEVGKLGRSFIPAIPIDNVESGRYVSGVDTLVNNFCNAHVAGFTIGGQGFIPIVYRRSDHSYRLINDGYLSPNIGQLSQRGQGE